MFCAKPLFSVVSQISNNQIIPSITSATHDSNMAVGRIQYEAPKRGLIPEDTRAAGIF